MITDEADDLTINLGRLPVLEPDSMRAERNRRCYRIAIARPRQRTRGSTRAGGFAAFVIESVLIGALGAAYLFAVVNDVLQLYRIE